MPSSPSDTIAAIITPPGIGGVTVMRISGGEAMKIAASVVTDYDPGAIAANSVHRRSIVDERGELVDEVLITLFRAPHSYTGEDVIEISCHGNPIISQKIMEMALKAGARMAEPGEFTRRAYLCGKIDLAQAEAVSELIVANSEAALRVSRRHLRGEVGKRARTLMDDLVAVCGIIELDLDFSEEKLDLVGDSGVAEKIDGIRREVDSLLGTFRRGKLYAHGITVAIVGKPNVGKSSLLNRLAGEERAIVSPIPGTTRDVIDIAITHGGLRIEFWDTAGVRSTAEGIELLGIARAKESAERADVVVEVLDGSKAPEISGMKDVSRETFVVLNKTDLGIHADFELLEPLGVKPLRISAKTGAGVSQLLDEIVSCAVGETVASESGVMITNQRHFDCLRRTSEALSSAAAVLPNEGPAVCALELRTALDALGEIVGTVTPEEVLNAIFATFCIGK